MPLHQASIAALNAEGEEPIVKVLHVDDQTKDPQPWIELIMPGITQSPFSTQTEHTKTSKEGQSYLHILRFYRKTKISHEGKHRSGDNTLGVFTFTWNDLFSLANNQQIVWMSGLR